MAIHRLPVLPPKGRLITNHLLTLFFYSVLPRTADISNSSLRSGENKGEIWGNADDGYADTTTSSSYSLSGTLESESPACSCGSQTIPTQNPTSQLSELISYVPKALGY